MTTGGTSKAACCKGFPPPYGELSGINCRGSFLLSISTLPAVSEEAGEGDRADLWERLRMHYTHPQAPIVNANEVYQKELSPLDKLAAAITDKVGSMGFFLLILTWTILWTGYNILASEVPGLRWKSFDPFPAFVAYLLISNVIQILLMPLIMVGQNVQSRHSEIRA